jgi:membrane protease YdiL (CAAX protease family)
MKEKNRKQLKVYLFLILIDAIAAAITVLSPLPPALASLPNASSSIPKPLLVLANFGLIFVGYGLLGLLGYFLSRKNNWPGIYKEDESWKILLFKPLLWGITSGLFIIIGSKFFQLFHNLGELPHPPFPYSIAASFAAGIGEELLMRLLLMSFWAWLLNLIFRRFNRKNLTDWVAIVIAAVIFGIGHLVGPIYTSGFTSLSQIPIIFIIEMLVLNGFLGIVAGRQMIKYGFIAAAGVHFWTDIIWHVIYGLF